MNLFDWFAIDPNFSGVMLDALLIGQHKGEMTPDQGTSNLVTK